MSDRPQLVGYMWQHNETGVAVLTQECTSPSDRYFMVGPVYLGALPAPAGATSPSEREAEALARRFHETYERLAVVNGYQTRKESRVPWEQVPETNRRLMIATCAEILGAAVPPAGAGERERALEMVGDIDTELRELAELREDAKSSHPTKLKSYVAILCAKYRRALLALRAASPRPTEENPQ